jgi:aminoglycoside phosphotransferase (APT) family kinase protein
MVDAVAIPEHIEDVDARWMTRALQATCPGIEVVDVTTGGPTGGIAITSRVARLRLQLRPGTSGPTAVVVKLRNPAWAHGETMYQREVRFYRELAAASRLPVPRCYHAAYDESSGAFAIVLEDVGDVRPGHRLGGLDRDEAGAVLDAIATMHAAWWNSDQLRAAAWPGKGYPLERAERMLANLRRRWPELEARGHLPVDDALRAAVARIDDRFPAALTALGDRQPTLIHSDLHAENLLLDGLRVIAIDWQNASFACCAFDVAMVLTAVQPDVLRADLLALLARYTATLARPDYPAPHLLTDVTTCTHWMLAGGINWYLDFEAESIRDTATVRAHWTRLATAAVIL